MNTERATTPVQVVLALYAALRDSQIDALALVDPQVICRPIVRPGLSVRYWRDEIPALIVDLHATHGRCQVRIDNIDTIDSVAEEDSPTVIVRATIIPEPGRNLPPVPVTSVYTLRNGLITYIDSCPTPSAP